METIIYIMVSTLLIGSAHVWSAVKSGCFYGVASGNRPVMLEKYIKNLHYAQTPFWYSLFGGFFFMLLCVFRLLNPQWVLLDVVSAYLVMQGCSSMCGPLYQGFVNVGSGLPFVDPNENTRMELADPLTGNKMWVPRFWHGRNRVWLSGVGLAMAVLGMLIQFHAF